MEYKINNLSLLIVNEKEGVKVNFKDQSIYFKDQKPNIIFEIISTNYKFVFNYYKQLIDENGVFLDIENISMYLVLHYLYMYNLWKTQNKKNITLEFKEKDFQNMTTFDIIIQNIKNSESTEWEKYSSLLLGMELKEFKEKYEKRLDYYNK